MLKTAKKQVTRFDLRKSLFFISECTKLDHEYTQEKHSKVHKKWQKTSIKAKI